MRHRKNSFAPAYLEVRTKP